MIYIPYLESSASNEAPESEAPESETTESETTEPISLSTPKPRDGREPLRHLLLGSQEGVDKAIQRMQVLHYAELISLEQADCSA